MKDIDFSGKVAVVTGAASGMGLMTAQEFARLGAKVFMCSDNASFVTGTNHVVDGGRLCMYQPYVPLKEIVK